MNHRQTIMAIGSLIAATAANAGLPASDSGLVSLLPTQSAQLNVVNLDNTVGSSCKVNLSFIDSTGAPALVALDNLIPAGATAQPLLLDALAPVTLRAHIDYTPQLIANAALKDPMTGCYNLVPTLEVIDATGTRVIVTDFVGLSSANKPSKIDVCHNRSHNPHTINIAMSAWKAHQAHGDTLGACPQ